MLHCECGFEARAEHEEELVAEVRRHALEAHSMVLSHDDAALLVASVKPGANAPYPVPRETTSRTGSRKEEQ